MEQAFSSGVVIAETASQLVLGGFCSAYFIEHRRAEWLGFGIGCAGFAAGSWALAEIMSDSGYPSRGVAMAFTVGTTLAVSLNVFGLAWLFRHSQLRALGWLAAIMGVLWQLALGYAHPFAGSDSPAGSRAAVQGWIAHWCLPSFLLYLAGVAAVAAVLVWRAPELPVRKRHLPIGALLLLSAGCAVDATLDQHWTTSAMLSHSSLVCSIMLMAFMVLHHRTLGVATHAAEIRLSTCLDELSTAQATVERLQRELGTKKQLAVVGELAAAIAHEVRNPLAIIMNAAAGLRRPTIGSEDRATLLSILDEETARLNRLVTDLLRFARPVIIKRSTVSILELARRAEGRLEDKHRLQISVSDQPHLKSVEADANLLRLVFDNLVSNAFQAMPDGGTVEIVVGEATRGDAQFVRIDIVDQGHGMDEQVLARATDPFYTTRPSGTGLGLPIVQRIVEAHGGQLEIDSTPGQGTRVSLLLPLLAPGADTNALDSGSKS